MKIFIKAMNAAANNVILLIMDFLLSIKKTTKSIISTILYSP